LLDRFGNCLGLGRDKSLFGGQKMCGYRFWARLDDRSRFLDYGRCLNNRRRLVNRGHFRPQQLLRGRLRFFL
jgi:hypothetical protein